MPANAGIRNGLIELNSRLRANDEMTVAQGFPSA
jgi:hypothetical protein